jgi:non-ribosomal peptide synthetase component F
MRRAAAFFADREAVVHGNDRLTFAQTWERGCRLANGLIGLGLKPGDRVAVLEGNSTARSRRVECCSITASFIGLRHLGQVSFIKKSKDMVRVHWR